MFGALLFGVGLLVAGGQPLTARAQTRLPPVATAPALPEPIYWKQEMFLVPYQWSSATEAGAAHAVWLFVSRDRGVTWQKISEARPHVTSFHYRAEGDGEYWFAVRTIDALGRAWPAGPYQPELRVIVDTTLPQFSELSATQLEQGEIAIVWRASDANLDPASLKIEAQTDASGTLQPVAAQNLNVTAPSASAGSLASVHTGQVLWTPSTVTRPLAIRATIFDRAGNPATYQAPITWDRDANTASSQLPSLFAGPASLPKSQSPPTSWISSAAAAQTVSAPPSQPWPGVVAQRAPFRLFSEGPVLPDDGITAYGNPPEISALQSAADAAARGDQQIAARLAPSFTALQPFRQASVAHSPTSRDVESLSAQAPPGHSHLPPHVPPVQPKLVGSRTFALEYDLDDAGRWGITKVELWGTRDGGRTWHRFARDDDYLSPIVVTVDEEGLYGFRIVAESSGAATRLPSPGDKPELWVTVDVHRPIVELTAIERGVGNLSDHLILRWQAKDDNLESRPISLYYSSRPAGPWSAIATNLEDTGEYAWRVERHVPERIFLRLEARDTAGNLSAFQTRAPIELSPSDPTAQLRDAGPAGTTATGGSDAYR